MRQVGGMMTWYTQDPYPPGRQQTNRRIFTIAEVLSKEKGVQVPHQAPQIGVLNWEDEPPDCLAFKTSIAYFQKTWGAMGNRHIFTHFGIKDRGKNLKGAGSDAPLTARATQRRRRQWKLIPWTQTLAVAGGSLFYDKVTGAGKCHFGMSSYQLQNWPHPSGKSSKNHLSAISS